MSMVLNEDQQLLKDSAKNFLQERTPVAKMRKQRDEGLEWSKSLWGAMAEMGWTGVVIPEAYGGLGFGYVGAGQVLEECGRTLCSSPLTTSALVCASLVRAVATEAQCHEILPRIATGECVVALAATEGRSFDIAEIAMTATSVAGGFSLSGSKVNVFDAGMADHLLVIARTSGHAGDQEGLSVFVIACDAPGIRNETLWTVDSRVSTNLHFDAVQVGSEALLGKAGSAWGSLQHALNVGAAMASAEMLGIAQESFERTVAYMKTREQFGVVIGGFQALQHRAAQLFCEIELCKSLVLKALTALDIDDEQTALYASAALVKCSKVVQLAVNEAVQLHGGMGMTDECDLGLFMKRSAACRQVSGDRYFHAQRIASLRGY